MIYGSAQTVNRLGNYLKNTAEGQQLWQRQIEITTQVLNKWDFLRNKSFSSNRYIYSLGELEDLSLVYLLTGHPVLGQFIKAHLLQVAALPMDFWVHAELRGLKPEHPLGMLETAVVCTSVGAALSALGDFLTKDEHETIALALRQKGLTPTLNWLQKPSVGNFTGVIGSGALVAANYLNDSDSKEQIKKVLTRYLNESIEKDGSYGEGLSYFNFPIGALLSGVLCLSNEERQAVFSQSGLRKSAAWVAYSYLFNTDKDNKLKPHVVHFGDNPYSDEHSYFITPTSATNNLIANVYQEPLAAGLLKKFNRNPTLKELLLRFSTPAGLPEPTPITAANLPLMKVFDSGDCYIRSTWEDNGIVLALRSGDGSRVRFNHQRPELNSISMGAYGEYFVVSSGSASYRSPLYVLHDHTTRAANTIVIDDKNQLFPAKVNTKHDNSAFWLEGMPKAEVVFSHAGKTAEVLVSEAAQAYFPKMKHATRTIIFVKDPGYFVMMDRLEAAENTKHKFSWRVHLNNRDEQGLLQQLSENNPNRTGGGAASRPAGRWHLDRPLADLDVRVFSDKAITSTISKGYMHGEDRDYSPKGKYEGKEGSSIELEVHNAEKTNAVMYYAVLYPAKNGTTMPRISYKNNTILVGKDNVRIGPKRFTIRTKGQTEKIDMN